MLSLCINYVYESTLKVFQELWHQSKDIVNCVVNILSSLGDGSSDAVDANNRAQLNQPAF